MRLTYNEALASIIEHTETGYTIASQDRLWIVFTYDLDSDGDRWSLRYNRLYPMTGKVKAMNVVKGTTYDRDMDHDGRAVPVFTTRAEAEFFAESWREQIESGREALRDETERLVYVMNLGDDARFEAQIIGRYGVTTRDHPKFKGSEAAWAAMAAMGLRWHQWCAEREQAEREDDEPSCP